MRTNGCSFTYGNDISNNIVVSVSTAALVASNLHNEGRRSSSNGNVIIAPAAIGALENHRRALTSEEYHSRLYHNTHGVKCRDDSYSCCNKNGTSGELTSSGTELLSTSLPSTSMKLQENHTHQISQQVSQHDHYEFVQHQQNKCGGVIQQRQQHRGNSTTTSEPIDDVIICSLGLNNGSMVPSKQMQVVVPTSLSMSSLQSQIPPLMYAVHKVVTTAQIQTAAGNTFTSSSSVSSIVSEVRNETESVANILSSSSNVPRFVPKDISNCSAKHLIERNTNSSKLTRASYLSQNSPGFIGSTRDGFPNEFKAVAPAEVCLTAKPAIGGVQVSSRSKINYVKKTYSISRSLQNVIPTCVYLMSRVAVHMEIEGTAQCPSQVMLAAALGCEELGIANKLLAQSIFGLWMTSGLLEIQLKSYHRPYAVQIAWSTLLERFSHGNSNENNYDEPMIVLKRNVFFSKRDEERIKDYRIFELLYEEAKQNVITGRYIMESVHSLMLGGIQARIELGPFNSHIHTVNFFRENQSRFLPKYAARSSRWPWLPFSQKNSAEVRLLEQFKRVPQTATTRKLMRKYLEFCWALPFYGAAFFHGQVEQPICGLISLVNHKDIEVLIAVNERGIFIIDPEKYTLLLGLRYEDLSWDFAKPSANDESDCQTCIFLQFDFMENGMKISKLVQIFSKQASMVDALMSHFAENLKKRKLEGNLLDQFYDEPNLIQNNGSGVLCNKLSRLTLATFDEEGRCIGQMGSLSISY